jgi:hypothetical protein
VEIEENYLNEGAIHIVATHRGKKLHHIVDEKAFQEEKHVQSVLEDIKWQLLNLV